jgi:hypothetical protein
MYSNCPPKMADGRMFTDYRPRCIANMAQLQTPNQTFSSYEYRQYMVKNATVIMKQNRQNAYTANQCGPCMEPYNEGTMLNEQSTVKCDAQKCTLYGKDAGGIGTGREYNTGGEVPGKAAFLAMKAQEQEAMKRTQNCCATTADDMLYYPLDYNLNDYNGRAMVPSGSVSSGMNDRKFFA